LEELKLFLEQAESDLKSALLSVRDKDEAWNVILQYRASRQFVHNAESSITAGRVASEFMQEGLTSGRER
jgi:hypothetical protein